MKQFFTELFEYNYHCNQQLAAVLSSNENHTSAKAVQLFNHILNAHQVWNNRIAPNETAFRIWEIHSPGSLNRIDANNYEASLTILDQFDLDTPINYTNTKGLVFNNSIRDTLFHVINHSTYHRTQIATEFKSHGKTPLSTDYILMKR